MTALERDTIVAIATAPGRGGVGIVRVSGSIATDIGRAITGKSLTPRHAHFSTFIDNDQRIIDSGIALYFPSPNSFTGEDIVELQAHGGPVVLDLIVKRSCHLGARLARPGEFSERAYLNNKLDLAQAEAIADLINSSTEQAALNATRSLQGDFSKTIKTLVTALTQLRVYVEAAIDFPEEEIDFIADGKVLSKLESIAQKLQEVKKAAQQGSLVQEGMKLVIAGKPNAGKSSLLNALSGHESAIVTSIEGTTRDVLRENIQIDGMPLHIVDTAGLRETGDEIELEGMRRARQEINTADHILLVIDGNKEKDPIESIDVLRKDTLSQDTPITLVRNKCDLSSKPGSMQPHSLYTTIALSAKTGEGVDLLKEHLKRCIGYTGSGEGGFSARRRHLRSLEQAEQHLNAGLQQLGVNGAGELLAEDLKHCQISLGEITGAVSSDELLGEIFSSFCIGK